MRVHPSDRSELSPRNQQSNGSSTPIPLAPQKPSATASARSGERPTRLSVSDFGSSLICPRAVYPNRNALSSASSASSSGRLASLWQVLGIYLLASWVVFQVIQTLTERLGLPDWVPAFAFVLLLIGLPIVLATALPPLPGALEKYE